MSDVCNGCGLETDQLRFLRLPDDDDETGAGGWCYCSQCFSSIKLAVTTETGGWPYGEFEVTR